MTTLEWVHRHENLVLAGASGTGKSHFVEALAHTAIDRDLRVAWFTLETLTANLAKAKVELGDDAFMGAGRGSNVVRG